MTGWVCDIETRSLEARYTNECPIHLIGVLSTVSDELYIFESLAEFKVWWMSLARPLLWFHNAAFDVSVLRTYGLDIKAGEYRCTMVLSHTLRRDLMSHSLGKLTDMKFDLRDALRQLTGKPVPQNPQELWEEYSQVPHLREVFIQYLGDDLRATKHLLQKLRPNKYYRDYALPLIEVIMELQRGIYVDVARLDELEVGYAARADEVLANIHKQRWSLGYGSAKNESRGMLKKDGTPVKNAPRCDLAIFNPNSPDHVAELLQSEGVKPRRGKTKVQADKTALFVHQTEMSRAILQYRALSKAVEFCSRLKGKARDGVLYPSFNQVGTHTGRFTCSDPNIAQIPSKGERVDIRSAFVAPSQDYKIITLDLAQSQLTILAAYLEHYEGDATLSGVITNGGDIHQFFADIYGCQRSIAKNVTFGYIFGAGVKRLVETASFDTSHTVSYYRDTITRALDNLQQRFPQLPKLRQRIVQSYRSNRGCFRDWVGAEHRVVGLDSSDSSEVGAAERQAFCYSIQGLEASFMNARLIQLYRYLDQSQYGKLINYVYDEVVVMAATHRSDVVAAEMAHLLTVDLSPWCPSGLQIKTDVKIGNVWAK